MHTIAMNDVHKTYDDRLVLEGLHLEIPPGEVFALLGPNGAGKTTAVEILEGYRRPDHGQVEVLGRDPARSDPGLRARIGIVLQTTSAFEHTTVTETVAMFAAAYPDPLPVAEAVDLVGLGPQGDQLSATLSGGQRRRLDLACGLVGRPEVLFLDEPTTGLDPEARRSVWAIVNRLRAEGTTVLLTTHYLDEAGQLADRIGVLIDGRLRALAEPERLGIRGSDQVRVRFVPGADHHDAFAAWDQDGPAVWTTTDQPAGLVADLVSRYGELDRLTIERPSLEDAYLELLARAGADR